jgi:hypothetical protein
MKFMPPSIKNHLLDPPSQGTLSKNLPQEAGGLDRFARTLDFELGFSGGSRYQSPSGLIINQLRIKITIGSSQRKAGALGSPQDLPANSQVPCLTLDLPLP